MPPPNREKQEFARRKVALRPLYVLQVREPGIVGTSQIGQGKTMTFVVEVCSFAGRRQPDALSADDLGHEIVGQVVMEGCESP